MKTRIFLSLLGVLLLTLWGRSKVFEKMGISRWKGWIPLYGGYLLYQKIWKPEMFFLSLMGCCGRLMNWAFLGMAMFSDLSFLYDDISPESTVTMFTLTSLELIFFLAGLLVHLRAMKHLSACFCRGWSYAVGLTLLPPIFFPHLGLGIAQPAQNAVSDSQGGA